MTKVFSTCWWRGAPRDPENHFPIVILWYILYIIYLYTYHFQEKIPPPKKNVSKWWPMIYFVSHHFNFGKNMKNHFAKGIFQWNLSHNRKLWIQHCWNKNSKGFFFLFLCLFVLFLFFCFLLVGFQWKVIFSHIPPNLCHLARKRRGLFDLCNFYL